jgi:hypothetical protein
MAKLSNTEQMSVAKDLLLGILVNLKNVQARYEKISSAGGRIDDKELRYLKQTAAFIDKWVE